MANYSYNALKRETENIKKRPDFIFLVLKFPTPRMLISWPKEDSYKAESWAQHPLRWKSGQGCWYETMSLEKKKTSSTGPKYIWTQQYIYWIVVREKNHNPAFVAPLFRELCFHLRTHFGTVSFGSLSNIRGRRELAIKFLARRNS